MNTLSSSPSSPTSHVANTLHALRQSPVVLCIRLSNAEAAEAAAMAALRGGLQTIEITLTTPHALSIITRLVKAFPQAVIGAGTVLSTPCVQAAAQAGARFIMSPVVDTSVIHAAHTHDLLAIPGALTPTEIHMAYNAGAHVVKIFPISVMGGISYVRALKGPLAHIPLLPTSGITLDTLDSYLLESNVLAIGASSQILTKDAVANEEWHIVEENARVWADRVEKVIT